MKNSFGNMTVELNIFDITRQPKDCDEDGEVCMIRELLEESVNESNVHDPLEACLAQFGNDLDLDKLF